MKAIAAVAYLKVINNDGECHVGFVFGKAKLVPSSAHTIPRFELGAAVLAVEMTPDQTVYISNRFQRIRKSTKPEQWHYVCTTQNPADHAHNLYLRPS